MGRRNILVDQGSVDTDFVDQGSVGTDFVDQGSVDTDFVDLARNAAHRETGS